MNFRSITDLTELESLPDDAKILVIDGGTAKQISKENAKFGGGGNTIFYTTDGSTLYTDSGCTTAATAQEVFDACMNGVALMMYTSGAADMLILDAWQDADGGTTDMTNVAGVNVCYIIGFKYIAIGTLASSSGGGK